MLEKILFLLYLVKCKTSKMKCAQKVRGGGAEDFYCLKGGVDQKSLRTPAVKINTLRYTYNVYLIY